MSSHKLSFIKVAETTDLPNGKMMKVQINDKEVLIANIDETFYAIDNRCSHQKGDLSKGTLNGKIITCPVHGSQFDVTSGKSIRGPKFLFFTLKTDDLNTYELKIDGDNILVFQKSIWGT